MTFDLGWHWKVKSRSLSVHWVVHHIQMYYIIQRSCQAERPLVLEWIGALESARLLELRPDMWIHSWSREQAIDAACQLHRDVCLMTTNLNVLDQYVLCPKGTASKTWNLAWVPGTFHPRRWLRVPWAPGFVGLRSTWRPWVCGALRWIRLLIGEHSGTIFC